MNTVDKPPPAPVSVDKRHVQRASIADVWRVPQAVWRARRALNRGDLGQARALVGPLFDRFGSITFIRKLAAEVLYASGDPLSAASLFEQAAKKLPGDRAVAVGLVASYAALNRAGDARRSALLLPEHVDVRLALAWSELVALGGDRKRGAELVREITRDPEIARSHERVAMHLALDAIARAGDRDGVRATLRRAEREASKLRAPDRAFLGYLGGIALRDAGLIADARATFALAMEAAPDSIGAALARRERASLDAR
jgi:tetratricopeptide (TPR) repeat protein